VSDIRALSQKKILIVEDDPIQMRAISLPLERKGYEVTTIDSGERAIDWLAESEHVPDLVILDVVMPGLNGYDVCRAVRAGSATAAVPVIFLTARRGREDMAEASSAGSDLYLMKPVVSTQLLNMVQMFLSTDVPLLRRSSVTLAAGAA
jgi:DNA-binding response OmpR family regulator